MTAYNPHRNDYSETSKVTISETMEEVNDDNLNEFPIGTMVRIQFKDNQIWEWVQYPIESIFEYVEREG